MVCSLINDYNYHYGLIIGFGIYTGLRISDILNLSWKQIVDYSKFSVIDKVIITEQKTKKTRIITIHPDLKKHIQTVVENCLTSPNDWVFPMKADDRRKADYHGINKALKSIFKKYKISTPGNISSHCLRKTFGRRCFEQGGESDKSLILLSSIFRHSNTEMTRRYLGIAEEEISDVYRML